MRTVIPRGLDRIATPVSPFGDQADGHAVRWAKENQLIQSGSAEQRLARTRPGTLAAYCYPIADPADLCLLPDWVTWLFILDDVNDGGTYGQRPELPERTLTGIFFDERDQRRGRRGRCRFSREGAPWFWEIVTEWDHPEDDRTFHGWLDSARADIRPHLRSNAYVNPSTDDGPAWRRGVWGTPTNTSASCAPKPNGIRITCSATTRTFGPMICAQRRESTNDRQCTHRTRCRAPSR